VIIICQFFTQSNLLTSCIMLFFLSYQINAHLLLMKPRHISICSRINDISGMSLDQSTHMVNTSIDVKEITAIFFAIFGINTCQVSKKEETSGNQKKKLHLAKKCKPSASVVSLLLFLNFINVLIHERATQNSLTSPYSPSL
jgi:hypothetical protein